jgi:hypothetical protein
MIRYIISISKISLYLFIPFPNRILFVKICPSLLDAALQNSTTLPYTMHVQKSKDTVKLPEYLLLRPRARRFGPASQVSEAYTTTTEDAGFLRFFMIHFVINAVSIPSQIRSSWKNHQECPIRAVQSPASLAYQTKF